MPKDPTGDAVRNLVQVRRLGNGLARDVRDDIRAMVDDFITEIIRGDPTSVRRTRYRRARVEKLLARLKVVAGAHYPEIRERLEAAVARVGKQQAGWAAQTLQSAVGDLASVDVVLTGVGVQRFRTIIRSKPFHGELMRDWFGRHERRTLALVRQQIQLGMAQDESIGDIVRRIRGRAVGGGPRPTFRGGVMQTSTRDAEAIARTAVNFISNEGHLEAYTANDDILGGLEFTATLDNRTTQICARWDGTVWPVDDPAKQVPPLHVNCFPGDTYVSSRHGVASVSKRWFDGDVVVICTASGLKLTCTPNHPVLTDIGWLAAKDIDASRQVVRDLVSERPGRVDRDGYDVPTPIEQVAESLLRMPDFVRLPVPVSAEDFHGDGVDGQVAIVGTARSLVCSLNAALAQHRRQLPLVSRDMGLAALAGLCSQAALFHGSGAPPHGFVGGRYQRGAFGGRGAVHPGLLLLAAVADVCAVRSEYGKHGGAGDTELFSDGGGAYPGLIDSDGRDLVNIGAPGVRRPAFNGRLVESTQDGVLADAKLARDIVSGRTGPVACDDVVNVERQSFSGHVFNLETGSGYYTANGLVVHNCRSVLTPVVDWKSLGVDPPKEGMRASKDGQVKASTTYEQWFRGRTPSEQNAIIGPKRAQLFRDRKITFKDMIGKDNRVLTLDEIDA